MPTPWNVPEHADTAAQLDAALAAPGRAGAVLLGPDGVGKSTLARLAAERYSAEHPHAVLRRVTGTPTERAVPFGAFSRLVEVSDIGKPAALLRSARESLRAADEDLLIVDDATAIEIRLRLGLGLRRLGLVLAIDQDDIERFLAGLAQGLGQLEMDREQHGVQRQRNAQRHLEGAAGVELNIEACHAGSRRW